MQQVPECQHTLTHTHIHGSLMWFGDSAKNMFHTKVKAENTKLYFAKDNFKIEMVFFFIVTLFSRQLSTF